MTVRTTFTEVTILDFYPDHGWRALYWDEGTPEGYFVEPVVGWLRWKAQERRCGVGPNHEPVGEPALRLDAAVLWGDGEASVEPAGYGGDGRQNFWRLVPPGGGLPTPEEVAQHR